MSLHILYEPLKPLITNLLISNVVIAKQIFNRFFHWPIRVTFPAILIWSYQYIIMELNVQQVTIFRAEKTYHQLACWIIFRASMCMFLCYSFRNVLKHKDFSNHQSHVLNKHLFYLFLLVFFFFIHRTSSQHFDIHS